MANILEYQVHFKYSAGDAQELEKFYTPGAARAKVAAVELWGGTAVIVEGLVDESELDNGIS